MQEVEEAAALLRACRNRTPHTFVVSLPALATSTLGDTPIDHAMANLLLSVVVRRLHAVIEQKSKIVLRHVVSVAVFAIDNRESVGERSRLRDIGRVDGDVQKLVAVHDETAVPAFVRHFVAPMPRLEKPPCPVEQFARPAPRLFVRMFF